MTGTHRTTITIPVTVHYELTRSYRGSETAPPEPGRIEITGIRGLHRALDVPEEDEQRIIDEIAESLEAQAASQQ